MKKIICTALVIFCSLILFILVSDCTCQNNAQGAENEVFQIPEELLSQKVVWEKCKLFEEKMMSRKAECTDITVPLYWDNPEGDTITIHVKRLRSLLKAKRQMWLLDGGPGNAGTADLPQFMQAIAQQDWKTDLYTLDHRGTGYSKRQSCPGQETSDSEKGYTISENEWDACIEHLEANYNLDAFTVTQAAKDVGFLIELLKEEDKEIFLYGWSYGTYWAHRYAQIFPGQAGGIILDSVVPSVGFEWDNWEIHGNDVVEDFFDICKEDEFCRSKMGNDPWGKANDTFEKFKDGHCPELSEYGLTSEFLQLIAWGSLDYWDLTTVLLALYYRLDRCNEEDVKAINYTLDNFLPLVVPPEGQEVSFVSRQYSDALLHHIGLSELMSDNPVPPEEMKEIDNALLASSHYSYRFVQLLEKWPKYEPDMYYRKWASQEVPILMLNGTLDQKTTIDEANIAKENLTGPNQYFIKVPNARHGVIMSSPVKNIFAPHCGMQIMLGYMEDPLEEPDTSCLADLKQIDFRGNPLVALLVFGTLDIWGNNVNTSLTNDQISLMKEEVENVKHDLRQR